MNIVFDLSPALVIGLVLFTILPLLVGLVTKVVTHPGVKAVLLALFSAVAGILVELLAAVTSNQPYDLGRGLVLALTAFLVAVGMHYGIWKPTGAAEALQGVGSKHSA
jgi:hypothetical protein